MVSVTLYPASGSPNATYARPVGSLTVGFDLDMTLVDTRAGIRAAYRLLSEATGTAIDADAAAARLGPPLENELARWFPAWEVAAAATRFRALYATTCEAGSVAMPGAAAAVEAVRARGGRVVVATAKTEPLAERCLAAAGLDVDVVEGRVWGAGKGAALARHGAAMLVGDHTGDVAGARAGGVTAVAVATGPVAAEVLDAAGADVVLSSLREFPGWLAAHLAGEVPGQRVAAVPDTRLGA